jgi:eukaryotic-like serine/threonine-protein kinase
MTVSDEDILGDLLLRWEELHDRGQDTPASELAKDHQHLVAELDRRIARLKRAAWLDRPSDDDPPADGGTDASPSFPTRNLANRYRLDELIAEGGFAQVFRAYDRELQRTVAIKLPKPSRLESTDAFLAEARRVARLKHPHLVQVYDVGLDGTTCFIVSEYIEGGSLADRLVHTQPAKEQVLKWIADIADALEYAHLNGVIHRDIKPANILIDHHGRALLADFGIAQSASKTGKFAPSLGTLRYMSPEQLEGKASDHRSDIFSLAVVLHEALTGRLPYSSTDPNTLRAEIAAGSASQSTVINGTLDAICCKALSKSLHDRHASAAAFAADIRKAIAGTTWSYASRWPLAAGILAAAVCGIPIAGWVGTMNPTIPVTRSPEEALAAAKTDLFKDQIAAAESGFDEVLAALPLNVEALDGRGCCRLKQGQLKASIDDFSKALQLQPRTVGILRHRASAYAALRQFDDVIADLREVSILLPGNDEATVNLSDAYALRSHDHAEKGNHESGANDMTEAITLCPDIAINYRRRASCWFHLEEYEKAVEDLSTAISKQPSEPEFYEKRALCFQRMGREEDAGVDLRKAAELRSK